MKIKYIDVLPRYFPSIPSYPKGIGVVQGDILAVTEKEGKWLMNTKNGGKSVFEAEKKPRPIKTEEIENGSRE